MNILNYEQRLKNYEQIFCQQKNNQFFTELTFLKMNINYQQNDFVCKQTVQIICSEKRCVLCC